MKKKVVYLRYWGSHFKSLRHVESYIAELGATVQRGWLCILVLERLPEDPLWLSRLDAAGIRLHQMPRPRKSLDWATVRNVRLLCLQLGVSVMACDNMHTSPLLGAAWASVPVRLWFVHNMSDHFEEQRSPNFRERLAPSLRLSCRLATGVRAVSQAVKDELVQLGISPSKIQVRHNPRHLNSCEGALDRAAARASWGFLDADVVIGTVGRAAPVKGWDILVDAFIQMANEVPRARLLLVGSCAEESQKVFADDLRLRLRAHNLEGRVVFAGYSSQVLTAYRAMDIFALPSRSEAYCCAIVEAIDSHLPCVAARVGIAPEVIQNGVNGFLVERCQPEDFAHGLLRLSQDSNFRDLCCGNLCLPSSILNADEYGTRFAEDCEAMLTGGI